MSLRKFLPGFFAAVLCIQSGTPAAVYEELVPNFDRRKSPAMIRKVFVPTRSNLDYAAYTDNPIRFDPKKYNPTPPQSPVTLNQLTFGGVLSSVCDKFGETPLTDAEKEAPMAWEPIANRLENIQKLRGFIGLGSKVKSEKWADPSIFRNYQYIKTAWLHTIDSGKEFWVKVEFNPWVHFLADEITDEDGDGFKEVYGKLSLESVDAGFHDQAFDYIQSDYQKKVLSKDEVIDWATMLSGEWYTTYMTDNVPIDPEKGWPTKDTEWKIRWRLRKVHVDNPIAVIRGTPYKKPIYNVYVVEGMSRKEESAAVSESAAPDKKLDTATSENFKKNMERFKNEVKEYSDYESWAAKRKPVFDAITQFESTLPEEQMGYVGKEDWVFFRKDIDYITGGDLSTQPKEKNPIPHLVELKKFLEKKNINLLFMPIPNKSEVYYENLPIDADWENFDGILNPYGRKFLRDCQEAGIEVIDLLPLLLDAKKDDSNHDEDLYQRQDTHWTNRGLQIAATAVADRIKEYAWIGALAEHETEYSTRDTTFQRQGDIVDKLPAEKQKAFPAVTLKATQVLTPEGKLFNARRNVEAPILLMGDSFTGVFELIDCKGAGIGANMAVKLNSPVDVVTSWGGGPMVTNKMLRTHTKYLPHKRVVVYIMVARDLYDYANGWQPLKTK
jgi:alginate O-acetyltransferase complex protein AlgJ